MGVMDYFSVLDRKRVKIYDDKSYIFEEKKEEIIEIIPDAKEITLAEQSPIVKGAITAHHLRDYRKQVFNLIPLPNIKIFFDYLIYGGDDESL